jgi:hypothetical protein
MTFTESKEQCAAILRAHGIGEITTPEETATLTDFFSKHHPKWLLKTNGEEVRRYIVKPAGARGMKCLYLVTDSTTTDIGIGRCKKVVNMDNRMKDTYIAAACRHAVDESVIAPIRRELKRRLQFGEPVYSELSGTRITAIHDAHIDHYNLTFKELVKRFIEMEGRDYLFENINFAEQNTPFTRFTDESISKRFSCFHYGNTHLRLVTEEENLSLLKKKKRW